jgi:signal transduction histidine kinase
VLDPESSRRKWARILALAAGAEADRDVVWELILRGQESLPEPRLFSVMWDEDARSLWMLQHRPDPRLDELRDRVIGVNSELASAQRELVKERGRLAHALDALEARSRELERSNRALDDFAHVVSHDLKAPLRSIVNHASWLEEDLGDALPAESRQYLVRLRERAERMRTMIQGVLEYARAGRTHARPERVDVGELLRVVVEMLDPPDTVEVVLEPGMPVLTTERAPLQQVFLNLIGNAVRHAGPESPRVRVSAGRREGFHEFAVEDNGPGIPLRMQDRIWTLFHTGDEAHGTGIGLAVVKKLVETQGGEGWVQSEPGAGATFRFLWPATPGPGEGAA